uniref:Uncharacterized protein n=1 Tax=Chromera velia CCMP2878 TaxID=1169474 RepID=A0A0G4HKG0_9ALVE|eukprot:Cvel_7296.t1-p1 / transcript=Cvel_7296.t1 / gene=Cvel_7296 / organism=Chromera_velia_CCMP2878 / gene_product=hypothetical protein / transcript_product=hypothetical protein / location=Cvel_scaffold377:68175-68837(-) / protein_length=221 / sequence_SO=supercontig / SO=protein_coding / is_pseudo=false
MPGIISLDRGKKRSVDELAKRMEPQWAHAVTQVNPFTEEEAWERIVAENEQLGILAALILSFVGPSAIQIPDQLIEEGGWRLETFVSLMGAAFLCNLLSVVTSLIFFMGYNFIPKQKTYEYMAHHGALNMIPGSLLVFGLLLFMTGWLIYLNNLPNLVYAQWVCVGLVVLWVLLAALYVANINTRLVHKVWKLSGTELTENNLANLVEGQEQAEPAGGEEK